jgi:transcription elongation factor GreA
MNETTSGIWLTANGYAELREELDNLTTVKRPEIAQRIRASQEHGEFSEDNSELDEVKFEQAMVEQRIVELKTIFGTAQVLNPDSVSTDYVGIGSKVTLEEVGYGETFDVQVVSSIEADPEKGRVSNESPIGDALMGQSVGETVTVEAPAGPQKIKILKLAR